jgi:nuclear pore complex protein Nup155
LLRSAFGLQELNVNDNLLVTVQKNLYALKEFLGKNPHLFHSTPGDPATSRNTVGHEQEAWKVCLRLLIVAALFSHLF